MRDLGQTRVFGDSSRPVQVIGLRKRPLSDLYHRLVTGSWLRLCLVYGAIYLVTTLAFAAAHLAMGPGAPGLPGSLLSALVALSRGGASPELQAALAPRALAAAALDGLADFVWWLELVIGAGVALAKFALLEARVLFSRVAVVAPGEDGPVLLFRMANERTGHVVDARVQVMLVRDAVGDDGEPMRRAFDLPLARGGTALFSHAWTAVHVIDARSPLADDDEASLVRDEAELLVTFSGYDEGLSRVINARHVYTARQLRFGARFAPIVTALPGGGRAVDYRRFHDTLPAELTARAGRRAK